MLKDYGVYLASAIDQHESDGSYVGKVASQVANIPGVSWVFNPKAAFKVGPGPMGSGIRSINAKALEDAQMILAFIPAGVISIGVPMEIDRALAMGKTVVVVSDSDSWMLEDPRIHRLIRWDSVKGPELIESLVREDDSETPGVLPMVVGDGGKPLTRGHFDDAGLDLYVSEDTVIPPGSFVDVRCNINVQLPSWSWGLITGRSSTLRKKGLLVNLGVIDAGYRGELFSGVFNLTNSEVKVYKGDRLAQLIIIKNSTLGLEPVQVERINEGSRGDRGFGSTGS